MSPDISPPLERFLLDWGLTLAAGGGACLLIGLVVGWIIWKNTRRLSEKVESGNREAFAEYENTSDEVSKIKAELSGGD